MSTIATAVSTTPDAEVTIDDSLMQSILGRFEPLQVFDVEFAIRPTPATIVPPIWTAHGSVRSRLLPTGIIALFTLSEGHTSQTLKVSSGLMGGYAGTMTVTLKQGDSPSLTLTYDLQQPLFPVNKKSGTYTFTWKA